MNQKEDSDRSIAHSPSSDSLDFDFEVIHSNLHTSSDSGTLPNPNELPVQPEESVYSSMHDSTDKLAKSKLHESLTCDLSLKKPENQDACAQAGTFSESVCTPSISLLKFSGSDLSFIETMEQCEGKNKVNEENFNSLKTEFDKISKTCEDLLQSNLTLTKEVDLITEKLSALPDFNKSINDLLSQERSKLESMAFNQVQSLNSFETPVLQDSMNLDNIKSQENPEIPLLSVIQAHCDSLEEIMKQNRNKYEQELMMMKNKEEQYLEMLKARDADIAALREQIKDHDFVLNYAVKEARSEERLLAESEIQSLIDGRVKSSEDVELRELKALRDMLLGDIQQKDMYILDLETAIRVIQKEDIDGFGQVTRIVNSLNRINDMQI
ncbi:unnamed protein product [Auanema sp. JU1783]|nr:unnamed protein product [Auanema sp. JU1783]